jgi:hypothetical protein
MLSLVETFTLEMFDRTDSEIFPRHGAESAKKSKNPPFIPLCQRGKEGDLKNGGACFDVAQIFARSSSYPIL